MSNRLEKPSTYLQPKILRLYKRCRFPQNNYLRLSAKVTSNMARSVNDNFRYLFYYQEMERMQWVVTKSKNNDISEDYCSKLNDFTFKPIQRPNNTKGYKAVNDSNVTSSSIKLDTQQENNNLHSLQNFRTDVKYENVCCEIARNIWTIKIHVKSFCHIMDVEQQFIAWPSYY